MDISKTLFLVVGALALGACASSSPSDETGSAAVGQGDAGADASSADADTNACSRTTPVPAYDLGVQCGATLDQSQLSVSTMCAERGKPVTRLAGACGAMDAVSLAGRDTRVTCFHERSTGRLLGAEGTNFDGKKTCFAAVDGFVPPAGCLAGVKAEACGQ